MTKESRLYIIKFLAIILITSFILDKLAFFTLNKISDKVMTGQTIGKLNHFLSVKDSTNLFVFGNSRANHHVDVNMISNSAFNMGMDGTDIAYYSTLIKTLPEKKAQILIVNVDTKNFMNLDYDGSDMRALKTKYQRNEMITKILNKSDLLNPLQHFYWSINYNNRVIGILKNYAKPKYDYKKYKGYDHLVLSDAQKQIRGQVFSESIKSECHDSHEVNQLTLNYLKEIKAFCDKNNKEFLAITTPVLFDNCNIDNEIISKIMKELSIEYWDFSNHFRAKKSQNLWKDKTHLSKEGAELFTTGLINQLKLNGINYNN